MSSFALLFPIDFDADDTVILPVLSTVRITEVPIPGYRVAVVGSYVTIQIPDDGPLSSMHDSLTVSRLSNLTLRPPYRLRADDDYSLFALCEHVLNPLIDTDLRIRRETMMGLKVSFKALLHMDDTSPLQNQE